jgi:hypothetical protein
VNRQEARQLADEWVVDAKSLRDAGRWHAAYYLAGYAVECGLKACVLAYIERTGIIFQDKRFAERCYTHDLASLVKAADLEIARGRDVAANPALGLNWDTVFNWRTWIAATWPRAKPTLGASTRPSRTTPMGCCHGSGSAGE